MLETHDRCVLVYVHSLFFFLCWFASKTWFLVIFFPRVNFSFFYRPPPPQLLQKIKIKKTCVDKLRPERDWVEKEEEEEGGVGGRAHWPRQTGDDESNIFTAVWGFFQSTINVHKFHQRKFKRETKETLTMSKNETGPVSCHDNAKWSRSSHSEKRRRGN